MHWLIKLISAITIFAVVNLTLFPYVEQETIEIPKNVKRHRSNYESALANEKPEIVLLGNSMLGEGIGEIQFEELIGASSVKIAYGGSNSAFWYLVLKNIIAKAEDRPGFVFLFFRDEYLTDPVFRTGGKHKPVVYGMADGDEPDLERLAYLGQMSTTDYWLTQNVPAFRNRQPFEQAFTMIVKESVIESGLGLPEDAVQRAIDSVFAEDNMSPELMTQRQLAAETNTNNDLFNFHQQLDRSFLPLMLEIAKTNDTQLHFVRVKKRVYLDPKRKTRKIKKYIDELEAYLNEHGSQLIDFTDDERIQLEHFGNGDHLNRGIGRELFTRLVVERIRPIISSETQ